MWFHTFRVYMGSRVSGGLPSFFSTFSTWGSLFGAVVGAWVAKKGVVVGNMGERILRVGSANYRCFARTLFFISPGFDALPRGALHRGTRTSLGSPPKIPMDGGRGTLGVVLGVAGVTTTTNTNTTVYTFVG